MDHTDLLETRVAAETWNSVWFSLKKKKNEATDCNGGTTKYWLQPLLC